MDNQINHWAELYEQTPAFIRWIFIILSGGLVSLAHVIWTRHQERISAIEQTTKQFAFLGHEVKHIKHELNKIDTKIDGLHDRVDEILIRRGGES